MTTRALLVVVGAAVAVLCAAGIWIGVSHTATATPTGSSSIVVGDYSCGHGWRPPHSGQRQLTVVNTGSSVVDVTLVGASSSLVYGELDALGPGITRTMTAVIPPGRYRVQCTYAENASVVSPTAVVTGPAVRDAHPYLPVTYYQMQPSVATYRSDVSAGLAILASDTDRLNPWPTPASWPRPRVPGWWPISTTSVWAPPTTPSVTSTTRSTAVPTGCHEV